MVTPDPADYTAALIDGPWRHEFVSANGARFHVATLAPTTSAGQPARDGAPLIVLLHSFPQFWWAWRNQIEPLVAAGYRVAALDMRGTGASDKPPIGYDALTRTRDVAGVIRSLGAGNAIVIGHGTGGYLAWAMAALQPAVTAGVAALSAAHPARMQASTHRLLTPLAIRHLAFCQLPTLPERGLTSGSAVDMLLNQGTSKPLDADVVATYRQVMRIPFSAHTAVESLRWRVRSAIRPGGRRFVNAVRHPLVVPALQVHGAHDAFWRRKLVDADGAALARNFRFEVLDDAGHFLMEDAPQAVTALLLDWLSSSGLPEPFDA